MPFEIVKSGIRLNFIGKRRICFILSMTLIVLGLLAVPIRGFRLGIDFSGGTEIQLRFIDDIVVDEGAIRAAVRHGGIENASVVRYGKKSENEYLVKFRETRIDSSSEIGVADDSSETLLDAVSSESEGVDVTNGPPSDGSVNTTNLKTPNESRAAASYRIKLIRDLKSTIDKEIAEVSIERVEFVGPKVGAELRRSGILSLSIACLLILVYIGFRFSARFAPGAVIALVHDVLITSSLWVIFGFEFDLRVLAALLAIVGYSLNDTIIVYDRIRENMSLRTKFDLEDVLNQSVNQTLSRTILTSLTTLLALLSLLFVGGEVIRPFALAMTLGVLVGTYSSIYVAAPMLLILERRFGAESRKTA